MSQDKERDPTLLFVVLLIGIMLAVLAFRSNYIYYVEYYWKPTRLALSWLLQWYPGGFFDMLHDALPKVSASDLTQDKLIAIDRDIALRILWAPAAFVLYKGVRRLKRQSQVQKKHDMESLLGQFSSHISGIKHLVGFNPAKTISEYDRNDPDTWQYAPPIKPETFARMIPPPGLEKEARQDSSMLRPIWDGALDFDIDLAERCFAKHVGDLYESPDKLTGTAKIIFDHIYQHVFVKSEFVEELLQIELTAILSKKEAVAPPEHMITLAPIRKKMATFLREAPKSLMKRIYQDGQFDQKFLRRLASDLKAPKASTGIKGLFSKKADEPKTGYEKYGYTYSLHQRVSIGEDLRKHYVHTVMSRHGFVNPALMSLLEKTRDGASIPPNALDFIKKTDRCLFYCINSMGRPTPDVEGAGAFVHRELEIQLGRRISTPMAGEAAKALREYVGVIDKAASSPKPTAKKATRGNAF